jgi:hypothetical protein
MHRNKMASLPVIYEKIKVEYLENYRAGNNAVCKKL